MASPTVETTLHRADPLDFEDVLCVLSDAAHWLRTKGIEDQWPPVFEENDHRALKLRHELGKGNVWLVRWENRPVATATITEWADPDFASGWSSPVTDALYVMRLATTQVARNLGLRLGHRLLDHAVFETGKASKTKVRLDCSKRNTALHAYYEDYGFRRVGTVDVSGRRSGALFEWNYDPNWRNADA
jgi:RimJ/RimL family protein N-acetyltransferase